MLKFNIIISGIFMLILVSVPYAMGYAQDRAIVPKRTWAPNSNEESPVRKYQPYNMQAILSGKQQQVQESRDPIEMAKNGELPFTEALGTSADTTQLRVSLQMAEPFAYMSPTAIEASIKDLKVQQKRNAYSMLKKRNAFYASKGLADDYTKFEQVQEAKAKAKAKLLTAGNQSSQTRIVQTKNTKSFVPSEVRIFMEETARLASLDPNKVDKNNVQTKMKSPLTRKTAQKQQAVKTGVVKTGNASENVIVPKTESESSFAKKVFPFFY